MHRLALSTRARVLAFLTVLMLDAVFVREQPWPVVIGCVAYLAIVLPALKPLGSRPKPTHPVQGGRMTETQPQPPVDPGAPVQPKPPTEPADPQPPQPESPAQDDDNGDDDTARQQAT